jgi:lipoprotein-releasing system permease protein
MGVDPDRMDRVVSISGSMVSGALEVGGRDAVLGRALLENLGLDTGDSLRLQAADGTSELFTVRGVFDLGNRQANETWVLVSLRNGQTLLELPGGVSRIDLRVRDPYAASDLASNLRGRTGLEVDSWMETNADLLVALRSQSASSTLIQVFVVLAVAIGIASVLVVSVVQRSREIGILRAMGVPRRRVLKVFLIQGGIVGILGSGVGLAGGTALSYAFMNLAASPTGDPLFPVDVTPQLLILAAVVATLTGLLAAFLPARRAAQLDPVTAIRDE